MYKFVALFSISMIFASTANAEGFYVGGTFGAGEASLSSNAQFADPDDRLYTAKGFAGYRVGDMFAVEGSFLGASNDDFYDEFDDDVDASFSAVTGSVMLIVPAAEKFELYGKVGGYIGESDVGDSFLFFGSGNEEDEAGLAWGAGAFINAGSRNQFTIRVDYEQFETDVFDDLWMASVGFQFNF